MFRQIPHATLWLKVRRFWSRVARDARQRRVDGEMLGHDARDSERAKACQMFGGCRVALKSGTRRVGQRVLPLNVTFMRQLVGVLPCFAVRSGQLRQEGGVPFQTHEARQLLRTHRGQC